MSDITLSDVMRMVDTLSYEQKKSLLERVKNSLRPKKRELKIHLVRRKNSVDVSIIDELTGIIKELPKPPYDNDPKLEKIVTKYESIG